MSELTLFADLFKGRTDAIGLDRGGVEHREVTRQDYEGHLAGHRAIGIFPMLAGDAVWFGAIDLDEPDFALASQMASLIPGQSWLESSRSGNAHIWVFFKAPAPAWAVRAVLRNATEAVGRSDVEIFPKQDQLNPGMVGNYINLPWFGDSRPILETDREAFLQDATMTRQDPQKWVLRARRHGAQSPDEREAASEWGTQKVLHRCAAYMLDRREINPLRVGNRHQVLFHLSKMLLNWEALDADAKLTMVRNFNEAGEAPIPDSEVVRLFENAQRGEFTSTGCDDPLMVPYVDPDCPIARGD